ncbi:16S rRNA (cytidine(1402)-2'-O)-methyltransferase [Paroceanicella profunda]|uniref:Ribosomal RNA small subunit methyltransferase I n=1 Tax=Paroceanicella profunda TaxID=2579971 RepID=A0A5B8G2E5_9RHOB|nr:16S rRNA (cytidine(1402)-2'-O)-methyltransferase [Paroceanicella profunda]QDL93499.1 16S rRNA (cytidine(1402)-2'-O)-methyltransferase [Paroceanicella profunda]
MTASEGSPPPATRFPGPDGGRLPPGLYLVATPIGTADDITLRALDILARADLLAAEDTRRARHLMDIHGIPLAGRRVIPYHDHNGPEQRPHIMARLAEGASVAYVSDAGTPLIADPGYRLAGDAIAAGHEVIAAPGASAVLVALTLAGLPTDRFLFGGFPPVKEAARIRFLTEFARVPATLVFYESPRRSAATLAAMADVFGADRPAAFCRELTKKFEEVRRAPLGDLAAAIAEGPDPRGEVVLVVGPPLPRPTGPEELDAALREALEDMSVKDAARSVAEATGLPRRDVYARALALSGK